jgi:hypothetical protein
VAKQSHAVDAAETQRLQTAADKLPSITQQVTDKEAVIGNAMNAKEKLQKLLISLPPAAQPETIPCPHCSKPLAIVNGKIIEPVLLSDAELEKRSLNISDAQESIESATKEITDRTAELIGFRSQLSTAQAASQELKKLTASKKPDASASGTVEDLTAKVALAQARLNAYDSYARARTYAALIEAGVKIVGILCADGLRLEILKKRLVAFNSTIKNICDVAGWASVEVKDDMSIWYRGTPYLLISTAAQFKTRVILQIACARLDGSQLVLIDAADVLASNENRMALIRLIISSKISAIIGMSFSDKSKVPRLTKVGGRSYWIENGVAEELA